MGWLGTASQLIDLHSMKASFFESAVKTFYKVRSRFLSGVSIAEYVGHIVAQREKCPVAISLISSLSGPLPSSSSVFLIHNLESG